VIYLLHLERNDERKTGSDPHLRGDMLFLIPLEPYADCSARLTTAFNSRLCSEMTGVIFCLSLKTDAPDQEGATPKETPA
jgi:hypothetical protein